jgi:hypothetical protein
MNGDANETLVTTMPYVCASFEGEGKLSFA